MKDNDVKTVVELAMMIDTLDEQKKAFLRGYVAALAEMEGK